jgi:hypothetical protein
MSYRYQDTLQKNLRTLLLGDTVQVVLTVFINLDDVSCENLN